MIKDVLKGSGVPYCDTTPLPMHKHHVLCDEQSLYPAELRGWERAVLATETQRPDFRCWYRNPDRPSQDSLGIAYYADGETMIMRPDFVFFSASNGEVVADIVDPHGHHLADAVSKLNGLALYAELHQQIYRRIEAVAEVDGTLRVLDLMRADVRDAVAEAKSAKKLYQGALARDYG